MTLIKKNPDAQIPAGHSRVNGELKRLQPLPRDKDVKSHTITARYGALDDYDPFEIARQRAQAVRHGHVSA